MFLQIFTKTQTSESKIQTTIAIQTIDIRAASVQRLAAIVSEKVRVYPQHPFCQTLVRV